MIHVKIQVAIKVLQTWMCFRIRSYKCRFKWGLQIENLYSRASLEWLEPAVFYDSALEENIKADDSSSVKTNKEVELLHLALDFAVECSILLRGQVENLLLEVQMASKKMKSINTKICPLVFISHYFTK